MVKSFLRTLMLSTALLASPLVSTRAEPLESKLDRQESRTAETTESEDLGTTSYSELSSKWYQEHGMTAGDFETLKANKKKFRSKKECKDWLTLNENRKVSMVADSSVFSDNSAFGTYERIADRVVINPRVIDINSLKQGKSVSQQILHEYLHSAQDHDIHNYTPNPQLDLINNASKQHDYRKSQNNALLGDFEKTFNPLLKSTQSLTNLMASTGRSIEKFPEYKNTYNRLLADLVNSLENPYQNSNTDASLNELVKSSTDITSKLPEENKKQAGEYISQINSGFSNLVNIITSGRKDYYKGLAGAYTGSTVEMDPRLAEVVRFWYEKTGNPITDKKNAEQAIDSFLGQKVPPAYSYTQAELIGVKEWYSSDRDWNGVRTSKANWKGVRDEIVERLQGIY